jgi:hypothetical protein
MPPAPRARFSNNDLTPDENGDGGKVHSKSSCPLIRLLQAKNGDGGKALEISVASDPKAP